jgi:hypothetical protein
VVGVEFAAPLEEVPVVVVPVVVGEAVGLEVLATGLPGLPLEGVVPVVVLLTPGLLVLAVGLLVLAVGTLVLACGEEGLTMGVAVLAVAEAVPELALPPAGATAGAAVA